MATKRLTGILLIGAASALTGCLLFSRSEQEPQGPLSVPFNHKAHLETAGLECSDCHSGATKGTRPPRPEGAGGQPGGLSDRAGSAGEKAGYPDIETCKGCHESGVKDELQPFERELVALADPVAWPTRNKLPEFVRFSHAVHATASVNCDSCHGAVGASEAVKTSMVKVDQSKCASCHQERNLSSDCSTCHMEGWGRGTKPPSHNEAWISKHGIEARAEFHPEHGTDCAACHQGNAECIRCHTTMQPKSHNQTWKERTHGVTAMVDRESCATCHREDSCQRCHESTRPRSHTGTWGGSKDRHCLSCHEPVAQENCAVCHRGTPSHTLANPQPAFHSPGMNCRQCHGNGQPLPHVDNGGECNVCHK